MTIKTILLITVVGSLLASCGKPDAATGSDREGDVETAVSVDAGNSPAEKAAEQISGEYMRGIVAEISHDRYEGRGPGSRGDKAAREFLATQISALGLEPGAGDGSWEQSFELIGLQASQPEEWVFTGKDVSVSLKQWDQFVAFSGMPKERVTITEAEVVFVGYGIQAPEYDWDDYKDVDLNGKVVLMMNNDPDWDPNLFGGETRLGYGRWDYKYLNAARQGAVGAIIIHTTPSAGYPFQVVQTSWSSVKYELPAKDKPRSAVKAWVTEDAARDLVRLAGLDLDLLREQAYNRDFQPVPLGLTTSIAMDVDVTRIQTANILGLIRGSDPKLRSEVVIYTAHHDHLGIGTPDENGDAIYNGAMDNATGVAQVMAIAKAIKALPEAPRRSILIALVGAEEQLLLGSEYYAANPTYAPGKIAANLNFDTGNIWGHTHDVTYIGLGKSSIDQIASMIAEEQGRVVRPDQFADKGYFYRSDQFSFARIGVPAMYLHTGTDFVDRPADWGRKQQNHYTEVNYHQPSDEYDPSWNFDGMVDDALLGFWTGLAIANKPTTVIFNRCP